MTAGPLPRLSFTSESPIPREKSRLSAERSLNSFPVRTGLEYHWEVLTGIRFFNTLLGLIIYNRNILFWIYVTSPLLVAGIDTAIALRQWLPDLYQADHFNFPMGGSPISRENLRLSAERSLWELFSRKDWVEHHWKVLTGIRYFNTLLGLLTYQWKATRQIILY